MTQHPNITRMVPYFIRAAEASANLDRTRRSQNEIIQSGLADCLDAPDYLPTGGYGLATVIGSRANCKRI